MVVLPGAERAVDDVEELKQSEPAATAARVGVKARVWECVRGATPPAVKTGLWLIKITIPLSFVVLVMKTTGVLAVIANACAPLFALMGLPGEAAVVFVTACLTNCYSAAAVIQTLGLSGRTMTIVAMMCLISHNLIVECAVQKKTGSSARRMLALRIGMSFIAALLLNLLMPADTAGQATAGARGAAAAAAGFGVEFRAWLGAMGVLVAKIMILVTTLMILERILHEFGVTRMLSRVMKYPLMLLGMPGETAFLWIVANVLGLAYGGGVIVENTRRGQLSQRDADTLNHHIAVSHSLLEDTCVFAAIGVSVWWITVPRIALAGAVVWVKRLADRIAER